MFPVFSTAVVLGCLAFTLTTDAVLNPPKESISPIADKRVCVVPRPLKEKYFETAALDLHNQYRRIHSAGPLEISSWVSFIKCY